MAHRAPGRVGPDRLRVGGASAHRRGQTPDACRHATSLCTDHAPLECGGSARGPGWDRSGPCYRADDAAESDVFRLVPVCQVRTDRLPHLSVLYARRTGQGVAASAARRLYRLWAACAGAEITLGENAPEILLRRDRAIA